MRGRFFHLLLLAVETAILSVGVMYPVFTGIRGHVSSRTFAREGELLRFRFSSGQDELLRRIRLIRIYYTSRNNPKFGDYYKSGTEILSEKYVLDVEYDPKSPNKECSVAVPDGLFDFRMDFYLMEAHPERCAPPRILEMSVGGRKVQLDQLAESFFNFKEISFPYYSYRYVPFLGGYTYEFAGASIMLWGVIMVVIVFFLRNERREKSNAV